MKLTNQIRELIKIDIKNGMTMGNLIKKYEVKKNIIRDIKAEIEGRQSTSQDVAPNVYRDTSQVVAPNESEIISEVAVTKDETTKEVAPVNKYLNDNIDILIEMIERYKKEHPVYDGDIVVKLPKEDNGDYKVSLRINKFVMQDFREFCRENKEFTQKELLSMALIEYMDKYRKRSTISGVDRCDKADYI